MNKLFDTIVQTVLPVLLGVLLGSGILAWYAKLGFVGSCLLIAWTGMVLFIAWVAWK